MFKIDCQKNTARLQRMKKAQSEIKPKKLEKKIGTTYCLGCKDSTYNFKPEEARMTNKVLRVKSNCVICQNTTTKNNATTT